MDIKSVKLCIAFLATLAARGWLHDPVRHERVSSLCFQKAFAFLGTRISEPVATPSPCGSLPSFFIKQGHNARKCSRCLVTMTKRPREFLSLKSLSLSTSFELHSSRLLVKEKKKKMVAYFLRYHLSVSEAKGVILAVTSLTFAHYVLIIWNHLLIVQLIRS